MSDARDTGSAALLETKLFAPAAPAGLIQRSRLIERMDRQPAPKLTLVSAPPGFGKSTLAAQWIGRLSDQGVAVAWVSLDEADNKPETFWLYVAAAFERASPGVAASALASLESGQPPPIRSLLAPMLNSIGRLPGRVVLALDDFHVIETAEISEDLAFLLEHTPPNLGVVIASRTDPALPLPRMRVRGELVEVRAADLRMTGEEAAAFLRDAMGIDLAPGEVAALEARTEGWVAALQLAALSLQGRTDRAAFVAEFSGDERYVVDYLMDEVLRGLEPAVREFLLQTSILERLSAPLCDAVTLVQDGRTMLDVLERRNLFLVPLDGQRRWFRYHHLFGDVLRTHLFERPANEVAALHRRASDWFAANGEPDPAIRHAVAGRDFANAALLVEAQAETAVRRHHPDRLVAWLHPLPEDVVSARPVLSLFYGHALQGMGDMEGSARWLDTAERAFAASQTRGDAGLAAFPALLSLGRGYLAMVAGDVEATVRHATAALEQLPKSEDHWVGTAVALLGLAHWWRGDLDAAQPLRVEALRCFERAADDGLAITSAYHDVEIQKARGRLREAQQRCETSLRSLADRGVALRSAANLYIGLSDVLCERNDLEGAERALTEAERMGIYPPRTPHRYLLAQARLAQCRGQLDAAIELLDAAERIAVRGAVPDLRPLAAWRARMWLARGETARAEAWALARGLSAEDAPAYPTEYEHITLARILLARGTSESVANAAALLERLLAAAEAGGRLGTAIEIRVLLALALAGAGRSDKARDALGKALVRAEAEGYVRIFVDEGKAIVSLLRDAANAGTAPAFCRHLIAAIEGSPVAPRPATGADALSEREMDVLRLLSGDMSGPQMANALFVSLNTLRTHTRNIYAKLGVTTRREAVRRAHELGLLG